MPFRISRHSSSISGRGRYLVAEEHASGHRLVWLKGLALHIDGDVFVGSQVASSPEFKRVDLSDLTVFEAPVHLSGTEFVRSAVEAAEQHSAVPVIMSADAVLLRLLRFGRSRGTRLVIVRTPESATQGLWRAIMKSLVLVAVRSLGYRVALLESPLWPLGSPAKWLVRFRLAESFLDVQTFQPADSGDSEFGPTSDKTRIVSVGTQSLVKHVDLLVRAVSDVGNCELLLLGRLHEAVAQVVEQVFRDDSDACINVVDEFVDEARMDQAISEADYVACIYAHDQSSGVAVKAKMAGTRVIARNGTRLARSAEQNCWGTGVDAEYEAICELLRSLNPVGKARGDAGPYPRGFESMARALGVGRPQETA